MLDAMLDARCTMCSAKRKETANDAPWLTIFQSAYWKSTIDPKFMKLTEAIEFPDTIAATVWNFGRSGRLVLERNPIAD